MLDFYRNKRVLVTGSSGFKGSWLCMILEMAGAKVVGYSLDEREGELFQLARIGDRIQEIQGDVRDFEHLNKVFDEFQPEIVFHLAAQPLVRESYEQPVMTYETNVMGTVYVLECVRRHACVKSVLNVTTDKVYENKEWEWGYRENEPLDGYDPYSNSKSCSELVTHSYKKSFFNQLDVRVSTARAGNVIGGGDFAKDRIIPDCIRAAMKQEDIVIRNPYAIRPFQHVLEPLGAYLLIAQRQWEDREKQGYYNVGPEEKDCVSTAKLATLFCEYWENGQKWVEQSLASVHEAKYLKLDCSHIKNQLGWQPMWDIRKAVEETVRWSKVYANEGNVVSIMEKQIREYMNGREKISNEY